MIDPSRQLRAAVRNGDLATTETLLAAYPDLLDNVDPCNGMSNLHYAVAGDRVATTRFLLEALAAREGLKGHYLQITNVDAIVLTFAKETVLHIACLHNAFNALPLLLDYFNVCLDQRDAKGNAPSHLACIHGHPRCLRILLAHGAYANLQNAVGDTPLHLALEYANVQCLKLLVEYNVDDTVTNNNGWTPLDLAFDDTIANTFHKLKARHDQLPPPPSASAAAGQQSIIYTPPIQTGHFQRSREPSSAKSLTFFGATTPTTGSFVLSSPNSKISLPTIQSRKFSINSTISDDIDFNDSSSRLSQSYKSNTPDFILPPRRSSINLVQVSPRRDRVPIRPASETADVIPTSSRRPSSMSSRTFRVSRQNTGGTTGTPSGTADTVSGGAIEDSPTGSLETSRSRGGSGAIESPHSNGSSLHTLSKMDSFKLSDVPYDETHKKRSILNIPILSSRRH